jgi:hypothetical protein
MTIDRPTTLPPAWAESLLRMVLNAHARDTVSGDLLEEYRQSIVPALGRDADSWYVRQMTRYVLHQTWMWGVLVAAIFVTPHVVPLRSALMHWVPLRAVLNGTLTAALSLGPAGQAWRSGYLRAGLLQIVVTALLGGVLTTAGTLACLAIWHDPATLVAIQRGGGLDEAVWGMSVLLWPLGFLFGVPGALVGRVAAAVYGASSPKTNNA